MSHADAALSHVYRELLQVALAQLYARNQDVARLEATIAAQREEIRRYARAQVETEFVR